MTRLRRGKDRMRLVRVCARSLEIPRRSLAQSRNVGSNDPMARSGQGGVRTGGPDLGSDTT